MGLNIEASVLLSGLGIVAAVVGSHVSLKTKLGYVERDLGEIKKKVLNGHFVRRDECVHCRPHEEEK